MLKSWSLENFKPIVNSGELRLAPVTVLAGRNSSGKGPSWRMHYWQVPTTEGSTIELANVLKKHDPEEIY